MFLSSFKSISEYKSPLSVVLGVVFRSRENQYKKRCEAERQREEALEAAAEAQKKDQRQQQMIDFLRKQNDDLKTENQQLRQNVNLPADPRLPQHHFGPRMISLSVNLARTVGLRAAARVLRLFNDWLGVELKVPKWHTIRTWLLRIGLSQLADDKTFERADDWIWLVDHSNQIGQEKVFVVLAVRASRLPEPGQALRHEDVVVLCVEPGTEWKCEDVARVYLDLEKRFGTPRGVLSDGAVELQDAAQSLENKGGICSSVFRDLKHVAANIFKSVVGKDDRFQEFTASLGQTRSQIQQTELAHLTPPSKKPKARFMNIGANLRWAELASWGLKNANAKLRDGVTDERMEKKLGWLRGFESELAEWTECQRIISTAVKFGAEHGISIGATEILRKKIGELRPGEAPQRVFDRMLVFSKQMESKLKPGERLPISTEILESTFGLYKSLEGQHSKGGFTSLLAAFPGLLRPATPESTAVALRKVSNKDVKAWTERKLGRTQTSRKCAAYAEHRKATRCATTDQTST
jgi:hypothetical protein